MEPLLHKLYDKEHFIEMVLLSIDDDRIEYYQNGKIKRKLMVTFCNKENQYCLLESNYNDDGTLIDNKNKYTFRRIYINKTIGYFINTINVLGLI